MVQQENQENEPRTVWRASSVGKLSPLNRMRQLPTQWHRFRTMEEAESLAEYFTLYYPDPVYAQRGLRELFINAIEHGNLELGYEAKSQLLPLLQWIHEIDRRLEAPEYARRHAQARCWYQDGYLCMMLQDQGPGFISANYLGSNLPPITQLHGRGIALARQCFTDITYSAQGNELVCRTRLPYSYRQGLHPITSH